MGHKSLRSDILWYIVLFFLSPIAVFAAEQRFAIQVGDSPQKGPANAPVTIIEFLDFQ